MKYKLIIASLLLASCSQDENPNGSKSISASACAEKMSDRSIRECSAEKETSNNLRTALDFNQKLDKDLPGPTFPGFDNQYRVINATGNGKLELEDGQVISLAGLECNHEDLEKYFHAVLVQDKNTKIVFAPTGLESNNIKYAYVWEVSTPMELNDSDYSFGPTWSPTNETAISSNWCRPVSQSSHKYHTRYIKIAEHYN